MHKVNVLMEIVTNRSTRNAQIPEISLYRSTTGKRKMYFNLLRDHLISYFILIFHSICLYIYIYIYR